MTVNGCGDAACTAFLASSCNPYAQQSSNIQISDKFTGLPYYEMDFHPLMSANRQVDTYSGVHSQRILKDIYGSFPGLVQIVHQDRPA